ncbi:MAG: trigger factor, partial [Oscillospiraceae bacterium]|nr:trigger factor [Oscillospiraceae bacterium]
DAIEELFPEVYKEMVLDQGNKAVGQPAVTDVKYNEDKSVDLTIETDLYPEIKLGAYKGLEAPKVEAAVSDEEVEKEIDRKANEVARIITVDRPAKDGDTAVIDYEGFKDGVPFEGGKGEGYALRLGSHSFIPGFEEQLIGLTAGEEKDLDLTFPEEYHAKELAGKAVTFKVKVHEVKETQVPAKDDELAKDVSEFDTLDELRNDIRAKMLKEKSEGIDRAFENAVLEKAADNAEMDVPAAMVDEEVKAEMERFDYQLRAQGMSLEQYGKMMGGDLSAFEKSIRPSAERSVRMRLTLTAIAEAEGLAVSDEEIEDEYKKIAESYGMDVEKIHAAVPAEEVKGDLLVRKARDIVVNAAVATEGTEVKEEAPSKE